jgi:hypothetical protein
VEDSDDDDSMDVPSWRGVGSSCNWLVDVCIRRIRDGGEKELAELHRASAIVTGRMVRWGDIFGILLGERQCDLEEDHAVVQSNNITCCSLCSLEEHLIAKMRHKAIKGLASNKESIHKIPISFSLST